MLKTGNNCLKPLENHFSIDNENSTTQVRDKDAFSKQNGIISCSFKCLKSQQKNTSPLTSEERVRLCQLYIQYGSKWAQIGQQMPQKDGNKLKNFFNNSLRKLATKLTKAEKQKKILQKRSLQGVMLHQIVDLSILTQKYRRNQKLSSKYDEIQIHKVREQILELGILQTNECKERILQLAKKIRKIKYENKNLKYSRHNEYSQHHLQVFYRQILRQSFPDLFRAGLQSNRIDRSNTQQQVLNQVSDSNQSLKKVLTQMDEENYIQSSDDPFLLDFCPIEPLMKKNSSDLLQVYEQILRGKRQDQEFQNAFQTFS